MKGIGRGEDSHDDLSQWGTLDMEGFFLRIPCWSGIL